MTIQTSWYKSSRSANYNCVETARQWRKSRRSSGTGNCVELADGAHTVLIRDSKHPEGGHLTVSPSAFAGLRSRIMSGSLDR